MRNRDILLALLIAISTAAISEASVRKELWDVDLLKLIGQSGTIEDQYVWGLAFSEDETKLAIGFNHLGEAQESHVIVVALDQPKTVLRRIDSDRTKGLEWFLHENIQWSPSGKLLAAYGRVFNLESDGACAAPTDFEFGGFLADDRIVFAKPGLPSKAGPEASMEIQARRSDCSVEDTWLISRGLSRVRSTCPQSNSIEVSVVPNWPNLPHYPKGEPTETHILRYPGWETTRRWTWDGDAPVGGTSFADSCRAICSGVSDGKAWHNACWSTETGEKIADDPKLTRTDREAFAGSGGALLAVTVSHWACLNGKFWQYLDMDGCASRPTRRVLWNVETGQEALSWPVLNQQYSIRNEKRSDPFGLAISATGKYLAEGGAGRVQLYSVLQ